MKSSLVASFLQPPTRSAALALLKTCCCYFKLFKNQNKNDRQSFGRETTLCSFLEYTVCCVQHDRIYLQTCTSSRQEAAATAEYRSPSSTALIALLDFHSSMSYMSSSPPFSLSAFHSLKGRFALRLMRLNVKSSFSVSF